MNWGKSIVLAFILFAGFIATLVTVCVRQDVSLVSSSYYKDELAYQQQMTRVQNVSNLTDRPKIAVINNRLELLFSRLNEIEEGELKLFRPSNSALDKTFRVDKTSNTIFSVDVSDIPWGMYRVKFQWKMNGLEYYQEEIIYL